MPAVAVRPRRGDCDRPRLHLPVRAAGVLRRRPLAPGCRGLAGLLVASLLAFWIPLSCVVRRLRIAFGLRDAAPTTLNLASHREAPQARRRSTRAAWPRAGSRAWVTGPSDSGGGSPAVHGRDRPVRHGLLAAPLADSVRPGGPARDRRLERLIRRRATPASPTDGRPRALTFEPNPRGRRCSIRGWDAPPAPGASRRPAVGGTPQAAHRALGSVRRISPGRARCGRPLPRSP